MHYSDLPYFDYALELLLHDVLEAEFRQEQRQRSAPSVPGSPEMAPATSATTGHSRLFPHAVAFVEQFSQFLDVVVKCARKTEVERWRYLFQYCGDPVELFDVRLFWLFCFILLTRPCSHVWPPDGSRRRRLTCWSCRTWRRTRSVEGCDWFFFLRFSFVMLTSVPLGGRQAARVGAGFGTA